MSATRFTVQLTFGEDAFPRYYGVFHFFKTAQQAAETFERWLGNYEVDGCMIAAQVIELDTIPTKRNLTAFIVDELGAERTDS